MTTEQLNQARAEAWRQAGNPLLTADDAASWLRETGVCLFLPRAQQLATAAPSFVEAVLGASDATPSPEAIETATRLLDRLVIAGDAIALNLLGTPGEQPDFLATTETLPFLFALTGDKEWKRGPRGKSSPLVIEVWKLLDREGPLTTIEVKEKLGRQLTEAAALRALTELWSHLRIEPVYKAGQPSAWQLLERSRQKQMQAGSTMSQAVALSALVSLYLQSAVAASGDEIEIFLSPLASRSKVRDAVRGLTATRQLSTLNLGPVELYHVEGNLPEFAEVAPPDGAVVEAPAEDAADGVGEGRRRFVAKRLAAEADPSVASARPETKRTARPATKRAPGSGFAPGADRGSERGSADRRPFAPRPGASGGERRPYGTRAPGGSSFNPREPWKEDRKPAEPRAGSDDRRPFTKSGEEPRSSGDRPSFAPRASDPPSKPRTGGKPFGERKPFAPRRDGDRKPFTPREGGTGERKTFAPRTGDRPFKPRSEAKPFGERKSFGDRKPFAPRGEGDRKPYTPREGASGERKPFAPRTGDRPFKPRSEAKPFGERKSFGDRKPFAPRSGGDRKPYTPREGASGEGKFSAPRTGDRPFKPRADAKPFGERKSFGDRKPFASRGDGDRKPPYTPREGASGDRKPSAPRTGDRPFKPRADAKPFGERKSFGERKPFAPRASGDRKPFTPRAGGGDRPFKPRDDAKPPRSSSGSGEGRPASSRPSSRATGPAGRPATPGARKAAPFRKTGKTTGATRARTSPMTSSGKPRSGVKPPSGRPGPRATRGGAAGARGGFKRAGGARKGRGK